MDFSFLRRRQWFVLILGFLFALLGTGYLILAISSLDDAYRLKNSTATSTTWGTILSLHKTNGGRGGPTYYVDYAYSIGSLNVQVKPFEISHDNWDRLHEGQSSIMIKYLVATPTVSEPALPAEDSFAVHNGWLHALISTALVIIGYWAALFSKKGRRVVPRKAKPRSPGVRRDARAGRRS